MSTYHNDTFYDTRTLSLRSKKKLLQDAYKVSSSYHIDKLVGFQRKRTDITFDDILKKLTINSHFVFIHRRGYENWKNFATRWCVETGFEEMGYFLFIYFDIDHLDQFIKKYKLKEKNV